MYAPVEGYWISCMHSALTQTATKASLLDPCVQSDSRESTESKQLGNIYVSFQA